MADSGDKVLVTGVSRGLGLAIADHLLRAGFSVVGVARTKSAELQSLGESANDRLAFEPFDLAHVSSIHAFAARLIRSHGRFYGLINNAAVGADGILSTMHEEDIRHAVDVNLVAPMMLCKYLCRGMMLNQRGRVINVASIAATVGFSGLAAYAATKAGLVGLTKSLSRELGKAGISVNAVSPGYLETAMTSGMSLERVEKLRRRTPHGRLGTVEEVAATIAFLMSPAASGIHGANIVVDLGSTA